MTNLTKTCERCKFYSLDYTDEPCYTCQSDSYKSKWQQQDYSSTDFAEYLRYLFAKAKIIKAGAYKTPEGKLEYKRTMRDIADNIIEGLQNDTIMIFEKGKKNGRIYPL